MLSRRDFLKTSSLLALAPTVPAFLARTARAGAAADRRVLVVVQLDGGNDALNTVVPFADPNYPRLRPTLARPRDQLVRLNDALGLHPALRPLGAMLEAGHLAILPGVGYPNPSRSHFTGMAIWHTARFDPADHAGYGWLGRALDPGSGASCAVHGRVPGALRGRRSRALALTRGEEMVLTDAAAARQTVPSPQPDARGSEVESLLAFVRRQALDGYAAADQLAALTRSRDAASYPSTGLAQRLQLVAQLLKTNLGARVF